MPLEVELLVTAWDNAKKNCFGGDGLNLDPETGEVLDMAADMSPDLADLVTDIDDRMMDLVGHYRDDYEDETFVDIRETAVDEF
jgi:gas vesicle protein